MIGQLFFGGYLRADGNDDASHLYDAAAARGDPLVAPVRKCREPGSGSHYQGPHGRRGLALRRTAYGKALDRARTAIERSFGHATGFGGGPRPGPGADLGLGQAVDQRRPHPPDKD